MGATAGSSSSVKRISREKHCWTNQQWHPWERDNQFQNTFRVQTPEKGRDMSAAGGHGTQPNIHARIDRRVHGVQLLIRKPLDCWQIPSHHPTSEVALACTHSQHVPARTVAPIRGTLFLSMPFGDCGSTLCHEVWYAGELCKCDVTCSRTQAWLHSRTAFDRTGDRVCLPVPVLAPLPSSVRWSSWPCSTNMRGEA